MHMIESITPMRVMVFNEIIACYVFNLIIF